MPVLGEPSHQEMVACLQEIAGKLEKPKAILVVSAHWEEENPTLLSAPHPDLFYDYYGFPEESYRLTYPAAGNPALAAELKTALEEEGFTVGEDRERGFDHGMFIPLKIMYPDADIPVLQLSQLSSLDPEDHIRLGQAIARLETEGLLVIGSGFSFHNMRAFGAGATSEVATMNQTFEAWLKETCTSPELSEAERRDRLINWDEAPYARFCHPREEHLLPLQVCYGAAGRAATEAISLSILGVQSSMYLW
ncbi:DODA-type extradiol aromatic ring-opening family dioxygenase [Sneathiella limimaris]|uniref:DODA-type extradiol aromatic ring-opening family dioxygenase n=1 Tax=Sneathiella limimaris TaxID=1964213 RepID=UPI0019D27472